MISKKILETALFSMPILFFVTCYADANQIGEKPKLDRSEIFPPEDGKLVPLQGKIVNRRYYAPKNVFSCQADDFGEGSYLAQDGLLEQSACVAFYSSTANFKKAEVIFMPGLEKKSLDKNALKDVFDGFGIGILKKVDSAQGIEVLTEEMVGDILFFSAISVEKMSVLKAPNGKYMSSTRGYLVFQDKDKLIVLSNQMVTLPDQKHDPKKHIEKLKREILEFKKTFEFGLIPVSSREKKKEEIS